MLRGSMSPEEFAQRQAGIEHAFGKKETDVNEKAEAAKLQAKKDQATKLEKDSAAAQARSAAIAKSAALPSGDDEDGTK